MKPKKPVYVLRRDNEYLVCLAGADGVTDPHRMRAIFSIYRYDAAPLPKEKIAFRVMERLKKAGEHWSVSKLDRITAKEEIIWTEAAEG